MTETLLLNEDLTAEYDRGYCGGRDRDSMERHIAGLRSVALFVARGGSQPEWDHCKACGGKILGTKYGEGRSYDGPGVPHVCKPREAGDLKVPSGPDCTCFSVLTVRGCPVHAPASFKFETMADAGKVTREELDAVKRDVRSIALGFTGVANVLAMPESFRKAMRSIAEGR